MIDWCVVRFLYIWFDSIYHRALATRALKTIVFREEGEKMNVWVALMNLEHKYGTHETVMATLEKAAQQSNPKHVFLHAAEMYERAEEISAAEELYKVSSIA